MKVKVQRSKLTGKTIVIPAEAGIQGIFLSPITYDLITPTLITGYGI